MSTISSHIRSLSVLAAGEDVISIEAVLSSGRIISRLFRVGDYAEYFADHFCHYGKIVSILDDHVTIEDQKTKCVLTFLEFAQRNYRFDLFEVEQYNLLQSIDTAAAYAQQL